MILTAVLKEKTHPSSTLSTTNLTWNSLGLNAGIHTHRPETASAMAPSKDIHNSSIMFTQKRLTT